MVTQGQQAIHFLLTVSGDFNNDFWKRN